MELLFGADEREEISRNTDPLTSHAWPQIPQVDPPIFIFHSLALSGTKQDVSICTLWFVLIFHLLNLQYGVNQISLGLFLWLPSTILLSVPTSHEGQGKGRNTLSLKDGVRMSVLYLHSFAIWKLSSMFLFLKNIMFYNTENCISRLCIIRNTITCTLATHCPA